MRRKNRLLARRALTVIAIVTAGWAWANLNAQTPERATSAALDAAIAGAHRSERNKARDQYRHPKETLEFFGLRPNSTVVEIWPGGGWYTEILAPVLRETGKLYVAEYGENPSFPYQRSEMETLSGKFSRNPEIYDRVTRTSLAFPDALEIAPPGSADLIVTFRNVHNWFDPNYGENSAPLAFRAFFAALKPGGILGIVDHRWPDPTTEHPQAANGYVSEARVIEYAEAAGFEFVGRSDVNANPLDTHDHPNGVWTLPPDLAVPEEQNRQKYLDIGESDRLTLKFAKP
jgi:predicted methyltransferase